MKWMKQMRFMLRGRMLGGLVYFRNRRIQGCIPANKILIVGPNYLMDLSAKYQVALQGPAQYVIADYDFWVAAAHFLSGVNNDFANTIHTLHTETSMATMQSATVVCYALPK